jgi:hypothetical protein
MRDRSLCVWLLGAALLFATQAEAAGFQVKSAQPFLSARVLHVNTRLDLELNARTEEALSKGIPIDVVIEVNLVKHRAWWSNKVITDFTLHRRIQFHALSRQYLVSGRDAREPVESFGALAQALVHAGVLEEFIIPLTPKKEIEPGARYLLQLRARLDIEALPMLMRPLAYTLPSWRLSTGWTEWPISHNRP